MLILISDAFDPGLAAKLAKFGEVTDDKSRQGDIRFALELFGVINTGGGGGVDE